MSDSKHMLRGLVMQSMRGREATQRIQSFSGQSPQTASASSP